MNPPPRSRNLFWPILVGFALIHILYGLKRFTLGIDFTDEGAYISWPMRMLFGEKLFESDPLTLLRPLQALLFILFKWHPEMTLYEFRMIGWGVHVGAFSILSYYLFLLSRSPWLSPLIASVPLFICNIFGLASPSYNSLSSDFFLIALSLRGLSFLDQYSKSIALNAGFGITLFVATIAHPGLGLVAGIILLRELLSYDLAQNLMRRRPTGSNIGVLVFVTAWLALFVYLAESGDLIKWIDRTKLFQSFAVTNKDTRPGNVYYQLAIYPFSYSRLAFIFTSVAILMAGTLRLYSRRGNVKHARRACMLLTFLLILSLICSFSYEAAFLPISFALGGMLLIGIFQSRLIEPVVSLAPEPRFLLLMSGLGACCFASLSFYFSPYRSWISGILGLPFAFSVGLTLLMQIRPMKPIAFQLLMTGSLILASAGAAAEHYRNIYRDVVPVGLNAHFHVPKLEHIKSTEERVHAIDALYDYLKPKLTRGEPLVAYDNCPMLYYLLDAKPGYGLTWAVRYTQRLASLQLLDREFRAKPLPRYAIRTLVNLANPVWSSAPEVSYDDYPLNETVMANYELEKTIFPFEIWRLKTTSSRK